MTITELHELARNPFDFDSELSRVYAERERHQAKIHSLTDELHRLAGDSKRYRNTSVPVWGLGSQEALRAVQLLAASNDTARTALYSLAGERAVVDALATVITEMDKAYTGWTRFFPSVTKSQPHIHRSLFCRTLHATTVMAWAPALSGKTDDQAVAELDEALCSVCFPDAPVALHEYVSKRSQADQATRAAEKADRDAAKAAKTLTEAEQFRASDGDRITTVAACKDLIRQAVGEEVTLDWYNSPDAAKTWTDPARLAQVRGNVARRLNEMTGDAGQAATVLMEREQRHAGWGMTMEAIAQMRTRKDKAARREWGL